MALPNLPFYKQSNQLDVLTIPTNISIEPNKGYFRIKFVDMRLARDFIVGTVFIPAVHAMFNLERLQEKVCEVVISPEFPTDLKKGDVRKAFISPHAITPVVPYDGRKFEGQIGLFAIPEKELVSEVLELFRILTAPIQRPEIVAALGLTSILRNGVNRLFSLDEAKLILSWKGEIAQSLKLSQQYILVAQSGAIVDKNKVQIIDNKVLYDGRPLERVDYFLFSVEVKTRRDDWHTLPEIKPNYDAWNRMRGLFNPSIEEYNRTAENLMAAIRSSPNLCIRDAERIIEKELIPMLKNSQKYQSALFRTADIEGINQDEQQEIEDFTDVDIR